MQAKRWQKSQKCADWRKRHHISHCPSKHKSHLVFHILLYIQLCGVLPLTPTVQQITEEALQDFGHFPTLLSGHKSKIHTTLSIYSGEVPLFGISIDIILSKNYHVCKQPDLSSTLNFHYLTDLHIINPQETHPLSDALTIYCFSLEAEAFDKQVIEAVWPNSRALGLI